MTKILFVCAGNLCRSPIAEAIARARASAVDPTGEMTFASAGTYPPWPGAPADARAVAIGKRRGYQLDWHTARRVQPNDLEIFDEVYAMDRQVMAVLASLSSTNQRARLALFLGPLGDADRSEVPDPYFGNLEGFERVFDLCEDGVDAILRQR